MTVQDLAEYLKVTVKTIYRLLERGSVPATRVGHLWRFERNAIDTWLRESTRKATAHILVIDDDATVGSLFKEALAGTGHIIEDVHDSIRGLEIVKRGNYDIVFLDLVMPGINGAAVFKQIKLAKPELPVVIITGYPDSEFMMSALASGPFGIMKKPFTGSDIIAAVNNYLRFGMVPQ
jgi:excisionase family DNA binding protein